MKNRAIAFAFFCGEVGSLEKASELFFEQDFYFALLFGEPRHPVGWIDVHFFFLDKIPQKSSQYCQMVVFGAHSHFFSLPCPVTVEGGLIDPNRLFVDQIWVDDAGELSEEVERLGIGRNRQRRFVLLRTEEFQISRDCCIERRCRRGWHNDVGQAEPVSYPRI